MDDPKTWDPADDDLPERKPLIVRVVAVIVAIGLVLFIADLFFALVLG